MQEERFFQGEAGLALYKRSCWPQGHHKAIVCIVHGINEHIGRYARVARRLNHANYAVSAFDLRGHGWSLGPRAFVSSFDTYIHDLQRFLSTLRERDHESPIFLLGHSLGGLIATKFIVLRPQTVNGLILSAPLLRLGDLIAPVHVGALERLLGRIIPKLPLKKFPSAAISRDPEVLEAYSRDPLVYHGRTRVRTGLEIINGMGQLAERMEEVEVPLLILHGTEDGLADIEGSVQLYERARSKDKTFKPYEGYYHEVLNEQGEANVLNDIVAWLDAHVAGGTRQTSRSGIKNRSDSKEGLDRF